MDYQRMDNVCKEEVYKSLFLEHAEHLRNFITYKSGDIELARDLVQEAFVKMWQNCKKVKPTKAKSYLFTIANNLFLNTVQREKVKLKFETSKSHTHDIKSPQYLMEEEEFRVRLEQAISALPEDLRIVFLMNRIDKKKYREIAELLNISTKAVEKRMSKALLALRKIHKNV